VVGEHGDCPNTEARRHGDLYFESITPCLSVSVLRQRNSVAYGFGMRSVALIIALPLMP